MTTILHHDKMIVDAPRSRSAERSEFEDGVKLILSGELDAMIASGEVGKTIFFKSRTREKFARILRNNPKERIALFLAGKLRDKSSV